MLQIIYIRDKTIIVRTISSLNLFSPPGYLVKMSLNLKYRNCLSAVVVILLWCTQINGMIKVEKFDG